MRNSRERLLGIACVALWAALSAGCVDSETGPDGTGGQGTTTSGEGGTGGHAGQGGEAGTGGDAGQGGAGGQGGSSSEAHGATEWASAGGVGKSEKYKMIFTFGQPIASTGKAMSSSYRIQGGVVGANGSAQ